MPAWAPGMPCALAICRRRATAVSGTHLAFRAPDSKAVDRFYGDGLKAGGRDNGTPGPRVDYSPDYYAAFLMDPDGDNVEAVFIR
jgi:hypothetical protein